MTIIEWLRRYFPWGVESGVRSSLLSLACVVGLIVIWVSVSDRHVFGAQVPWLTAGIAILMVSLYSQTSLFIRARRAIGERRAAMLNNSLIMFVPVPAGTDLGPGPFAPPGAEIPEIDWVLVAEGRSLYHLAGCPMAEGRSLSVVAKHVAQTLSLEPCGICTPRAKTSVRHASPPAEDARS